MKQLIITLILLSIFIADSPCKSITGDYTQHIDCLQIDVGDRKLNVPIAVIVNLTLKHSVYPSNLLYKDRLLVFNKEDCFSVFDTERYQRDIAYEELLNTHKFKNAFVVSDTLYCIDSSKQPHRFDYENNRWHKISYDIPTFKRKPIFENKKYKCYEICHGKWGGLVLFYNKENKKITYTPAASVVGVHETSKGYYISTSIDYLYNFSESNFVQNPDALAEFPGNRNIKD